MKQFKILLSLSIALFVDSFSSEEYKIDKSLYPISYPVFERKGYTLAYDGKNRIPLWAIEHLTKENVIGKMNRLTFKTDKEIYYLHQSTDADYKGSGFARGHIVPDADRDNSNDVLLETYLYSNVAPQPQNFNGSGGLWAKLENYVRDLVLKDRYESVDVITGPLFLPKETEGKRYIEYQLIGKHDVAVPTHFFKVLYLHKAGKSELEVYIIPVLSSSQANLSTYHRSLEELEKVSGLIFHRLNNN